MNAYKIGASMLVMSSMALPAAADEVFYDTARVVSVVPQTERINTPREECRTEYIRESYESGRSVTGSIIGGIAGGLLGSQIGKGNGRVAGAAVGAGVGAVVGDRIDNSNNRTAYATRPVQTCTLVDDWRVVERGYLVTYRFHGREYTTEMPYRPGNDIRVRVAVAPDNDSRVSYLEPQYRPHDRGQHRGWDKRRDFDRW